MRARYPGFADPRHVIPTQRIVLLMCMRESARQSIRASNGEGIARRPAESRRGRALGSSTGSYRSPSMSLRIPAQDPGSDFHPILPSFISFFFFFAFFRLSSVPRLRFRFRSRLITDQRGEASHARPDPPISRGKISPVIHEPESPYR